MPFFFFLRLPIPTLQVPVLRLDVISHSLRVLVGSWVVVVMTVGVIIMAVVVRVLSRPAVVHLVDAAALWAALDWTVAGDGEPEGIVGVNWESSASKISLFTERFDDDGILHGS